MIKRAIFILSLLFSCASFAQINTFRHIYGGVGKDEARAVIQTPDSGFVIVGATSSFGYGNSDVYLFKIDVKGNPVWSHVYGGINTDWGFDVKPTKDNGFIVVGYSNSFSADYDVFVVKTDSVGNELWSKTYGGNDWDMAYSIDTVGTDFIIAGETYSYGQGKNDGYLLKIDASGNVIWEKQVGSTESDAFNQVITTNTGNFIAVGYTNKTDTSARASVYKINSLGATIDSAYFGGNNIDIFETVTQDKDSNFVVAGATNSYGNGKGDFYTIKISTNLDSLWRVEIFGGEDEENIYSIITAFNNDIVTCGYSFSTISDNKEDVWIDRIESTGIIIFPFPKNFSFYYNERGYDVIENNDFGFTIVGSTNSFGIGYDDIFVFKTDYKLDTDSADYFEFTDTVIVSAIETKQLIQKLAVVQNSSNIYFDLSSISLKQKQINFYDIKGALLYTNTIVSDHYNLNTSSLSKGVIIYEVIYDNKRQTGKLLIK